MSLLLSKKRSHNKSLASTQNKIVSPQNEKTVAKKVDEPKSLRLATPSSRLWDQNRIYRLRAETESASEIKDPSLKDLYTSLLNAAKSYCDFRGILYRAGEDRRIKGQNVTFDSSADRTTSLDTIKEKGEFSVASGELINKLKKSTEDYSSGLSGAERYIEVEIGEVFEEDPSVYEMQLIFSSERPELKMTNSNPTTDLIIEDTIAFNQYSNQQDVNLGRKNMYYASTPLNFYK